MLPSDCPRRSEWRSFAVGDVDSRAHARLSRHVAHCGECRDELARHDREVDGFVAELRLVASGPRPFGGDGSDEPGAVELDATSRFEVLGELGRGTFGRVVRAFDHALERIVAVKVQHTPASEEDLADGTSRGARRAGLFQREARAAAQLDHPGIVRLYEQGVTRDGRPFLVSEYIEGATLGERLEGGRFEPRRAARLAAALAEALDYAHSHGVVHRDVKPSNVLLDAADEPHLTDFGLAKRERAGDSATRDGEWLGTPAYMPPELARGDARSADARSDVYSLGVVLYEMLTGERPFQGKGRLLLLQVLEDEPRSPRRLVDGLPRDLETITLRAMQKDRSRRYAGAGDMARDLRRFLAGEPVLARPLGPFERCMRWAVRNPVPAALLTAAPLASMLGFVHLGRLSSQLVHDAALDSARQYTEMLIVMNDLYSSEVVDRIGGHDVDVRADYASRDGAIPVPATLLTELLARIGEGASGMKGRHFSDHPFRTRADGGARDEFERAALASLEADPREPYWRFTRDAAGAPVLRYATARVMRESCVACHNAHPDSSRRDWEVGDVRGVLEVERPLAADAGRVRAGLSGSFLIVSLGSATMLALSFGVLLHQRGRRARALRGESP